jgi:hypothetical protein
VGQVICGRLHEAWETIGLEEELRRQEKKLEAEAKKVLWLEEFRKRLMRKELDLVGDMAWEVNFNYVIATWRQDMDVAYMRTQETTSTTTEMDHMTLLLEELWIKDRRLKDPGIILFISISKIYG